MQFISISPPKPKELLQTHTQMSEGSTSHNSLGDLWKRGSFLRPRHWVMELGKRLLWTAAWNEA